MTVLYIRCPDCGEEFDGRPSLVKKAYRQHLRYCEPIRPEWSWDTLRMNILKRDGFECRDCRSKKNLEVHHILPLHKGGTNDPQNLMTLCEKCHNRHHFDDRRKRALRIFHRKSGRNLSNL